LAARKGNRSVWINGDRLAAGEGDGAIGVDDDAADARDVDGVAARLGVCGPEQKGENAAENQGEAMQVSHGSEGKLK
jgi:hypothetical protein